ncbi:hypothetical protein ACFWTC_26700 [Streptomyces sp. NPDC058619]
MSAGMAFAVSGDREWIIRNAEGRKSDWQEVAPPALAPATEVEG